ncbi:uncharacterized protein F5147DRAFT_657127 [Suillus discolor]|uniref:Uncharacterized protein n=1 Tax=Suillus discolor TaxID=1912936 RepID=A0A9P7EY39_9AGAM|nr:uncharacterized protein F5147DRAFT_657127 [Suillus discolor]KAG2094655.1 hypothetical protein F5147DRAFT_657127 [Suillus discolor]
MRALPATSSSQDRPGRKKFKAVFGHWHIYNEQLIVAPCSMIIAQKTFFGVKKVASVKDIMSGESSLQWRQCIMKMIEPKESYTLEIQSNLSASKSHNLKPIV